MLSRVAESLYWLGRYMERAESTARVLDVHYHLLLEDQSLDEAGSCARLHSVLVGEQEEVAMAASAADLAARLAFDSSEPASIVSSLHAARENARVVRDTISSEMWECTNSTYLAAAGTGLAAGAGLARDSADAGHGPHMFFRLIEERSATFTGLADSSMSHDEGWHFLSLGRSIERAGTTARVLLAREAGAWGAGGWVTALRSCSAHEAFLRTYRRSADARRVVEFLALDRLFPRSIAFSLRLALSQLSAIGPAADRAGSRDEAQMLLGRAMSELEFERVGELLADLGGNLNHVLARVAAASAAMDAQYFAQSPVVHWSA
ncbi:MAG: alpha-E domain-containing protein [Acidimicrobiales bacterium]